MPYTVLKDPHHIPGKFAMSEGQKGGEWSGATWTLLKERPKGECGGASQIKQGNTYYEDLQVSVGRFDFVLANPPFNVSKIDKERLAGDPRHPFGIPRTDNGNYLWIQDFHSALNKKGRAGFVMADSVADARASGGKFKPNPSRF
jgi:hypothetical protein